MKLIKLLTIPAVLLICGLTAVPALANHAMVEATLNCTKTGKVCFDLTVSTSEFGGGTRDLTYTLLGHKTGDAADNFTQIGNSQTVTYADNLDNAKSTICFPADSASDFDKFVLRVQVVGSEFDVNGKTKVNLGPFANTCTQPTPTPTPAGTPTPTATPGQGGGSPSPSATASPVATAALAQTGGFDFRFPLIGLTVLVAGLALFLVSASRRRSTNSK